MNFYNRVKFTTSTTGTGSVTVGSAVANFRTPVQASVPDGAIVEYVLEEGSAWETGEGVVSSSGTVVSRSVRQSSNSDALITLAGAAIMRFTVLSESMTSPVKTIWSPDAPPITAGSADGEFASGSGGVPSGFTEYDPGSVLTVDESAANKHLILTVASGGFPTMSGIYRSVPAGNFTIWTKVRIFGQRLDYAWGGLALFEDATNNNGDIENLALANRSSSGPSGISQFTLAAYNSYSGDRLGLNALPHFNTMYFRWRRNSTSYYPGWSWDGVTFLETQSTAITVGFTPAHFGLAVQNSTSTTMKFVFDFFRYTASDVGASGILNGRAIKFLV